MGGGRHVRVSGGSDEVTTRGVLTGGEMSVARAGRLRFFFFFAFSPPPQQNLYFASLGFVRRCNETINRVDLNESGFCRCVGVVTIIKGKMIWMVPNIWLNVQ